MINIDGAEGEGGGQILRTALALSLCTNQPFRIFNVRAGRKKPGLLRQHLTAVRAAEQVGNATVSGAEIGSNELTFKPQSVQPGDYKFAVGTAGSATLVFQTVLPALLTASAESNLVCQGGTHNPYAPPYDFLERSFAPQVRRLGPALDLELSRPGFYPAGGGEFHARIQPCPKLTPFSLLDRGALKHQVAFVYLANLPVNIAEREIATLRSKLSWPEEAFQMKRYSQEPGPGNLVILELAYEHVTEIATGFGEKGTSGENVVNSAVEALRRYQVADAVVGDHLADQLLLLFALAGGGEFITLRPSKHSLTNAQTIQKFLKTGVEFKQLNEQKWSCHIS